MGQSRFWGNSHSLAVISQENDAPNSPNDPALRQPPHMAISTVDTCCFHSLLIIAAMLRNYWHPGQINRSLTTPTRPRGPSPSSPEPRASVCSAFPLSHACLGVHLSLSRFLLLPHTTTTLSHVGLEIRHSFVPSRSPLFSEFAIAHYGELCHICVQLERVE